MAVWKQKIVEAWDSIQLIKTEVNDGINNILKIGNEYPLQVEIDLKGLDCNDVGLEFIVVEFGEKNNSPLIVEKLECEVEKREGTVCCFKLNYNPDIRVHLITESDFIRKTRDYRTGRISNM